MPKWNLESSERLHVRYLDVASALIARMLNAPDPEGMLKDKLEEIEDDPDEKIRWEEYKNKTGCKLDPEQIVRASRFTEEELYMRMEPHPVESREPLKFADVQVGMDILMVPMGMYKDDAHRFRCRVVDVRRPRRRRSVSPTALSPRAAARKASQAAQALQSAVGLGAQSGERIGVEVHWYDYDKDVSKNKGGPPPKFRIQKTGELISPEWWDGDGTPHVVRTYDEDDRPLRQIPKKAKYQISQWYAMTKLERWWRGYGERRQRFLALQERRQIRAEMHHDRSKREGTSTRRQKGGDVPAAAAGNSAAAVPDLDDQPTGGVSAAVGVS